MALAIMPITGNVLGLGLWWVSGDFGRYVRKRHDSTFTHWQIMESE